MTPRETAVVLVTAPEGAAPRIAKALVEEHLAPWVNLVPSVRSVYRWEGREGGGDGAGDPGTGGDRRAPSLSRVGGRERGGEGG